jgi:phosphohistidine phosphatase
MKYLTLMRHGDAEEMNGLKDFQRALTDLGIMEVSLVSKSLLADGIYFDCVLSSSAVRAQQTTSVVASALQIEDSRILYRDDFYLAHPKKILATVKGSDNSAEHILIVGHNPGLPLCAELLRGERESVLPTAGCIGLALHIDEWKQLTPACASVRYRKYPE